MLKQKLKNTKTEKAIIIGVQLKDAPFQLLDEELDELALLADTAGAEIIDRIIQKKTNIDPSTFIGKGKMLFAINAAKELNCTIIIFNNELSPGQLKNIQKLASNELKIIDRTGLILDIFEKHARTKESKAQIQLARLKYLLPRLTKQWTHLERQMGGVGTRGGPGEAQIEVDRRLVRKQITNLKKELKNIQNQRIIQHKSRENVYKVSLSGYTNAGKSTIMKSLSKSNVYIQNQLFATLDTTTRRVSAKNEYDFLLSDTVGFIRNLPHDLIASFRSTLLEIEESDLIIKVIDASSKNITIHLSTIKDVFKTLNIKSNLELIVFNKIDLLAINDLKKIKKLYPKGVFISASKEIKINELLQAIYNKLRLLNKKATVKIPYNKLSLVNYIYSNCKVINRVDNYNNIILKIEGSIQSIDKIKMKVKQS